MNKVNNTSVNTGNENLNKLRRIFPQFVKENKIDFDALKKFFQDEEIITGEEKYGLNWAGKSNAFKLIRTPSVGTLTPQEKESKNWDKTENLFIEGDNLENLRPSEQQKIACGQKHFKAIDVNFKPVIQMTLEDLIN